MTTPITRGALVRRISLVFDRCDQARRRSLWPPTRVRYSQDLDTLAEMLLILGRGTEKCDSLDGPMVARFEVLNRRARQFGL